MSQNSLNLFHVEPKKLFYCTSQWFLSSSRLLKTILFLNLGLVDLFVFHIDKSQIDMILCAFSSHQIKLTGGNKIFFCLFVNSSVF